MIAVRVEDVVTKSELVVCRGEAQTKAGKKDQTQGHLKKKVVDLQRQIKQTSQETIRY